MESINPDTGGKLRRQTTQSILAIVSHLLLDRLNQQINRPLLQILRDRLVINYHMFVEIISQPCWKRRVVSIVNILKHLGAYSMDVFIDALKITKQFTFAEILTMQLYKISYWIKRPVSSYRSSTIYQSGYNGSTVGLAVNLFYGNLINSIQLRYLGTVLQSSPEIFSSWHNNRQMCF